MRTAKQNDISGSTCVSDAHRKLPERESPFHANAVRPDCYVQNTSLVFGVTSIETIKIENLETEPAHHIFSFINRFSRAFELPARLAAGIADFGVEPSVCLKIPLRPFGLDFILCFTLASVVRTRLLLVWTAIA